MVVKCKVVTDIECTIVAYVVLCRGKDLGVTSSTCTGLISNNLSGRQNVKTSTFKNKTEIEIPMMYTLNPVE